MRRLLSQLIQNGTLVAHIAGQLLSTPDCLAPFRLGRVVLLTSPSSVARVLACFLCVGGHPSLCPVFSPTGFLFPRRCHDPPVQVNHRYLVRRASGARGGWLDI